MTSIMVNSDFSQNNLTKKAAKAPVHHSAVSEHFQGDFPLFLNRWEEGFELREHNHAYLELVYVMSGEGYHYVSDRIERTGKGCLYILPIGTSHIFRPSGTSGSNKLLVYNLCILPEFIAELKTWLSRYGSGAEPLLIFDGKPETYISLIDRGMELGELFEQLLREFSERRWGFETSMFSVLLQLSIRIARMVKQEPASKSSVPTGNLRRTAVTNMLSYIDLNIAEPLTVEQLASEAGVSRRHFIRLFQQVTGMGFSDYQQHKRIEFACRLLLETDHKISHIAKNVGYRDPAHFREVFRKVIGTSPTGYRKKF